MLCGIQVATANLVGIFHLMYVFFIAGVEGAVELALKDIKRNRTILQDIELIVLHNNDGCHLDTVMRTFINYYVDYKGLLGVLGPPCSETVEPVASKCHRFDVITAISVYQSFIRDVTHTNMCCICP